MPPSRQDASRPLSRDDLRRELLPLGIDIDDEQSIERWNERRKRVLDFVDMETDRRKASRERTRAGLAGFARWLATGIGAVIVAWASGAYPWVRTYFGIKG